jgi:hypothetical protein
VERPKRRAPSTEHLGALASHSRLRAAKPALRYGVMREVLLGYLSPILVDSVLERALKARGLSAGAVSDAELAELASDIMVGLRLFVEGPKLSQLMLELADLLGELE